MDDTDEFLASILRGGARAFAGFAASALLEARGDEANVGLGSDPFSAWQDFLVARIDELAAASAARRPDLFAAQVAWAASLLAARGVASDLVRASLEKLRDVLTDELPAEVRRAAAAHVDQALDALPAAPVDASPRLALDTPRHRLAAEYLVAVFEGDRKRARDLILSRARAGVPVADIYLHVLGAAQQEIGRMWHANEISVAEEHFATATTAMVVAQLAATAPAKPPNGKTVLAAAAACNQHALGLQIVANLFENDGWRTIYLGANVPIPDLLEAIDGFKPDVLVLSAALSVHVPIVKATIAAVRARERGGAIKILVGGQAFVSAPDLWRELGADGFGATATEAVALAAGLVAGTGR